MYQIHFNEPVHVHFIGIGGISMSALAELLYQNHFTISGSDLKHSKVTEHLAMLLAGGQGSRLGVLTSGVAKPAVAFGGKYRIIDFPLSNCINSGVDTVGVLTQYQPLRLNTHIGIGIPWDLDRNIGGISILPPYEKSTNAEWYTSCFHL